MTDLAERLRHWRVASAETQELLRRNDELLLERAELLRSTDEEFREVVRLARVFTDQASGDLRSPRLARPRLVKDSGG